MAIPRNVFVQLAEATLGLGARKATKYLSRSEVVKATRIHKPDKRDRSTSILFTIGKPNYREREFIKSCLEAGESFPVKKLQLRWYK